MLVSMADKHVGQAPEAVLDAAADGDVGEVVHAARARDGRGDLRVREHEVGAGVQRDPGSEVEVDSPSRADGQVRVALVQAQAQLVVVLRA